MDPSKLKVVELRAELAKRGLDQKGVKAVLVARLQDALDAENKEEEEEQEDREQEEAPPDQSEPDTGDRSKFGSLGHDEASAQSVQSSEAEVTHAEEDSSQFVSYQEESESKLESEVNEDSVAQAQETSDLSSDAPGAIEDSSNQNNDNNQTKPTFETFGDSSEAALLQSDSKADVNEGLNSEPVVSNQEDESKDNFQNFEDSSDYLLQEDSKNNDEEQSLDTWQRGNRQEEESDQSFQIQDGSLHLDDSNAQDALETSSKTNDEEDSKPDLKNFNLDKEQDTPNKMEVDSKPPADIEGKEIKEENDKDSYPADQEMKEEPDQDGEKQVKSERRDGERERKNRWDDNRPVEAKKRQRSRSPSEKRRWSPPARKPDDEPDFDENAVLLSWYDSDLHMLINKENFLSASLISHSGFGYVWAGVRASFGFEKGKVYYEARITENISVPYLEDEPNPNVLRVGWSVQNSSLQLGEEPLSYGYGGTGKISTNCQFKDYGKPFLINDVIGCYLNFDSNEIEISFTVNGENQGVAYSIPHEELKGQPLFPHILSKNCAFEVNFGTQDPWSEVLPDFTNVGKVPLEDRIPGPKRPAKREECDVIMMIGLPGSGKTTWAMKYAAEHKDKMYNILGTNTLIDKMKVMGMPRRRNYSGRWETLIAKCTKCLNSLLEIAAFRRRNYIIDQTNVYPSAQRRKMRGFEGFVRRAVVVVPTDEELKARTAKREDEEGKDVPDTAVLEMKANFVLPEKNDVFDEIIYTELQEEEAKPLIAQYNKEGNDAGYFSNYQQQQKRFRGDDNRDRRDFRDDRRNDNRGRNDRRNDGWRDRGYNNRRNDNQRGGWGPPRQGGWRDNPRGGGGWRSGPPPNRFNDRGGPGQRDRGGRDYRDRRDGGSGGNKDRRDRDDKNRSKNMSQSQTSAWGNQAQSGYNQAGGWGQGYSNPGWGNWNQGYNQQQWKGYGQQAQQQAWGQQGWGNQGWGNTAGWNQQYNYQYPQTWGQAQTTGTADTTQTGTTDTTAMAASYANYGQPASQAGAWAGYTTVGSTGYASMGSTGSSYGTGTTAVTGSTGSTGATYTPTQKQYRQDPRKST